MAMNGLEKITEKILAEAGAEAARILAEAEAESRARLASYEARAKALREAAEAEADRECRELISRAKNAATVERRNALLRVRGELVDEAFETTLTQIRGQSGEARVALLTGLLCAAMQEQAEAEGLSRSLYGEEDAMAPDVYEVLFCAADRERYAEAVLEAARARLLGKIDPEKLSRMKISDKTADMEGGLILKCGDVESNCSFELLFLQLRRELEGEVSHALFDAKERL